MIFMAQILMIEINTTLMKKPKSTLKYIEQVFIQKSKDDLDRALDRE